MWTRQIAMAGRAARDIRPGSKNKASRATDAFLQFDHIDMTRSKSQPPVVEFGPEARVASALPWSRQHAEI